MTLSSFLESILSMAFISSSSAIYSPSPFFVVGLRDELLFGNLLLHSIHKSLSPRRLHVCIVHEPFPLTRLIFAQSHRDSTGGSIRQQLLPDDGSVT